MGFFRAFAFRVCKFLQGSFLVLLGIVVGSWVLFYALASTDAMDTVNRYFSWNWPMLFIVVFFLFPLAAVLGGLVTAAAGVTSVRRLVAIGVIAAWAVWVAPVSHLIDFRSPVNAFLEAAGATIAGAGAATAANFWMHHMTPLYHRWNNDYVAPYFGVVIVFVLPATVMLGGVIAAVGVVTSLWMLAALGAVVATLGLTIVPLLTF